MMVMKKGSVCSIVFPVKFQIRLNQKKVNVERLAVISALNVVFYEFLIAFVALSSIKI